MPELNNSQRRFFQATYQPLESVPRSDANTQQTPTTRAVEKVSFIQSLAIRQAELPDLQTRVQQQLQQEPEIANTFMAVSQVVSDPSPAAAFRNAQSFTTISVQSLMLFGQILTDSRRARTGAVEGILQQIASEYMAAQASANGQPANPSSVQPVSPVLRSLSERTGGGVSSVRTPPGSSSSSSIISVGSIAPTPVPVRTVLATPRIPPLQDAIAWAISNRPDQVADLLTIAQLVSPVPQVYTSLDQIGLITTLVSKIQNWANWTAGLVKGFGERIRIEPVGRLHLERLEMLPAGIERGELVHSVPLAPKETVNISHKEWATTTQEFDKIVEDFFEGYSEQGVAEKTDLAHSTDSESEHSNSLNLSATASGSYNGAVFSGSASVSSASENKSDDKYTKKDSTNSSMALTRKASARSKKDHKLSFKVTSAAGTEDQAVQVITNPSDTDAMRVDFYQLIRKWKVDLYRYGLRMTYDIVIPSPGADLMAKVHEIDELNQLIGSPFEFSLPVSAVTPSTWETYAATYQAAVTPPPDQLKTVIVHYELPYPTDPHTQVSAIEYQVDDGYEVASASLSASYVQLHSDDNNYVPDTPYLIALSASNPSSGMLGSTNLHTYTADMDYLQGLSGKVSVTVAYTNVSTAGIDVQLTLQLQNSAFQQWQFSAWSTMRQAAQEAYYQERQVFMDRLATLQDEIGKQDALTLRRMERVEVMKGVLRWLFGPTFELVPADIGSLFTPVDPSDPLSYDGLDPHSLTNTTWERVLDFGAFIRYIHEAIEWENMLFLLYPYFWDSPTNWQEKRFLDHPDPLHRDFLRAGSARIVLPIRRGFEPSFLALLETGAFDALPPTHPYMTIAQEIDNYAKTNYEDIPDANPGEPGEPGILLATWYEYTPTSALDISINTSLADMG